MCSLDCQPCILFPFNPRFRSAGPCKVPLLQLSKALILISLLVILQFPFYPGTWYLTIGGVKPGDHVGLPCYTARAHLPRGRYSLLPHGGEARRTVLACTRAVAMSIVNITSIYMYNMTSFPPLRSEGLKVGSAGRISGISSLGPHFSIFFPERGALCPSSSSSSSIS